jgi:uncharacterized protein (TIGR02246 family)
MLASRTLRAVALASAVDVAVAVVRASAKRMAVSGKGVAGVRRPEEWPHAFTERLNAGDLDGVMALYAPDARFVQQMGEVVTGRFRIREVIAGLVRTRARMTAHVRKAVTVGDVALLQTDFEGSATSPDGASSPLSSRAIEVLRRRPNGSWLLIVGDPNARA